LRIADYNEPPGLEVIAAGRLDAGHKDLAQIVAGNGSCGKSRGGTPLADYDANRLFRLSHFLSPQSRQHLAAAIIPISSEDTMQRDPVCNMQVDEKTAPAKLNHNGKDYYFCSQQCVDKFKSNPQQYTQAA